MSGKPKFSEFRSWVEPLLPRNTNGDRLRLSSSPEAEERRTNTKLAWFFAVVALLFALAGYLGHVKNGTDASVGQDSAAAASLTLSPPTKGKDGFSVRFRLRNGGKQSVFYPIGRTTSLPVGELVVRASPSSEWISLSGTAKEQRVLAGQQPSDSTLGWIEMPPGGWVDGEFQDAGEPTEEHAYVIYVKTARDAKGIRIVSESYTLPVN